MRDTLVRRLCTRWLLFPMNDNGTPTQLVYFILTLSFHNLDRPNTKHDLYHVLDHSNGKYSPPPPLSDNFTDAKLSQQTPIITASYKLAPSLLSSYVRECNFSMS